MSTFGAFTVTRASTKNVLGSAGTYVSVANNTPAFEFNTDGTYRGLLVEPGATNGIRNNSMQGAVAGAPGTLPTNWGESLNGLTREVVAIGTENGIDYIDLRFSGTSTGTVIDTALDTTTGIIATPSQVWTVSAWLKVVAAPAPPNAYQFRVFTQTNAGVVLAGFGGASQSVTSTLTRFNETITTGADPTTARIRPNIRAAVTSGQSYDFTIRIGWPQMETGSVATSPIVTTGSTASRSADVITLTSASSLIGQTEGTLYAEVNIKAIGTEGYVARVGFTTFNDTIAITRTSTNNIGAIVRANGASIFNQSSSGLGTGVFKVAIAYSANSHALYVNGASIATGTTALSFASTLDNIRIGSFNDTTAFLNDSVRAIALFPTRLSNAQLASLTA